MPEDNVLFGLQLEPFMWIDNDFHGDFENLISQGRRLYNSEAGLEVIGDFSFDGSTFYYTRTGFVFMNRASKDKVLRKFNRLLFALYFQNEILTIEDNFRFPIDNYDLVEVKLMRSLDLTTRIYFTAWTSRGRNIWYEEVVYGKKNYGFVRKSEIRLPEKFLVHLLYDFEFQALLTEIEDRFARFDQFGSYTDVFVTLILKSYYEMINFSLLSAFILVAFTIERIVKLKAAFYFAKPDNWKKVNDKLNEIGEITNVEFGILERIRKLRNKIGHAEEIHFTHANSSDMQRISAMIRFFFSFQDKYFNQNLISSRFLATSKELDELAKL